MTSKVNHSPKTKFVYLQAHPMGHVWATSTHHAWVEAMSGRFSLTRHRADGTWHGWWGRKTTYRAKICPFSRGRTHTLNTYAKQFRT